MEIQEKRSNGIVILSVSGKMDAVSVPQFNQLFDEHIKSGDTRFVLDFEGLTYISSAGLRGVLNATKQVKTKSGKLVLCGLFGTVHEVFHVSGFLSIFEIFGRVSEALEAI